MEISSIPGISIVLLSFPFQFRRNEEIVLILHSDMKCWKVLKISTCSKYRKVERQPKLINGP